MRPVRTPESTTVYTLPGGNEDNYLYAEDIAEGVKSVWAPTPDERALIAGGARIVLVIFGSLVPPVALTIERPFCQECRAEATWDGETQRYVCRSCHPPSDSDGISEGG